MMRKMRICFEGANAFLSDFVARKMSIHSQLTSVSATVQTWASVNRLCTAVHWRRELQNIFTRLCTLQNIFTADDHQVSADGQVFSGVEMHINDFLQLLSVVNIH